MLLIKRQGLLSNRYIVLAICFLHLFLVELHAAIAWKFGASHSLLPALQAWQCSGSIF